jgi:hypothetical protein
MSKPKFEDFSEDEIKELVEGAQKFLAPVDDPADAESLVDRPEKPPKS